MLPTTVSTAATTRSLFVTAPSNRSVMVRAARSTETSVTPGILRQPAAISVRQVRHMSSVISTVTSPSEADATTTAPGSAEVSVAAAGPALGAAGVAPGTTSARAGAGNKKPRRRAEVGGPGPNV